MPRSHTWAGNPNRVGCGVIEFGLDDGWRDELSSGKHAWVTLVTLPQLLYYGYRVSRHAADAT